MPVSTARIPQLDGLRALAIGSVMLHHLFHLPLLWGGVDLFFVLSGFLITGILINSKQTAFPQYLRHFYARRARRILPAYVIVLALTAALFGAGFLHDWPYYLGAMNFLKPLHLKTPDTLVLWSLAVEEQFYLLWPLAVFFLPRRALTWLAAALVVVAPILRYTCTPFFSLHWAIYMLLPFRMDTLATGALLALLWPRLKSLPKTRIQPLSLLLIALSVVALAALQHHGDTTTSNTALANFGVFEAVLVLVTAVLVLALLGFGRAFLSTWPMVWLGRISYSMYLVHLTMYRLLAPAHPLLAVLATIAYAVFLWFAVESPILRGGRKPPPALLPA